MNREEIPEGFKKQKVCHDDSTPPYDSYCSFCSGSRNCYSEEFILAKISEPDTIHINEINEQKQREELARERAIGFSDFIKEHCDWVCDQSGRVDIWGWETDIPEMPGLYTIDQLYSKYEEHLKK